MCKTVSALSLQALLKQSNTNAFVAEESPGGNGYDMAAAAAWVTGNWLYTEK